MTKVGEIVKTAPGQLDEIIGPEGNRIKLGLRKPPKELPVTYAPLVGALPRLLTYDEIKARCESVDRRPSRDRWGPDTIKDQDGRGACQGYASAGMAERVRESSGQKRVVLSGDFSYSLANGGRDQGSALSRGFMAATQVGYAPEDTPGLKRWEYRKSHMPQAAFAAASRFKGIDGFYCETQQEFFTALALGMIGVIAVHVAGAFSQLDNYGISQGGNGDGNHAVCADDLVYDRRLGGFKIDSPNSWKRTWGDNGRCYYTFERHLRRTIEVHKFYVFPILTQDPQGDNPPQVLV
ncbi:MAG: hypothetical protein CMK32_09990 [Porticoccaceae bacterium]|nr:hypothetical protein [Porticoccaceae bacterium]